MASVLLVDDHPVFRHWLRALPSAVPEIEVLGEGADGDDAVRMALELRPDVVVMDLQMPGLNGVEATRQIVAAAPAIGVLVLTTSEDEDSVFAAMRAGARGYLVKAPTVLTYSGPSPPSRAARRSSAPRWPGGSLAISPNRWTHATGRCFRI